MSLSEEIKKAVLFGPLDQLPKRLEPLLARVELAENVCLNLVDVDEKDYFEALLDNEMLCNEADSYAMAYRALYGEEAFLEHSKYIEKRLLKIRGE